VLLALERKGQPKSRAVVERPGKSGSHVPRSINWLPKDQKRGEQPRRIGTGRERPVKICALDRRDGHGTLASVAVPLRPEVKASLIRHTPLFAQCSASELKEVARVTDQAVFPTGTVVIREGDPAGDLYLVVEGAADVRRNGRKLRTLFIGDCFGELALLTGSPRTATVTAVTPLELLCVRQSDFAELLRASPTIGAKLARSLAERLEADSRRLTF
jgi:CRP/FNR family cyclic AMP-dependent transcriptional regulator